MKLRSKNLCVLERLGLLTILRAGQKCNNDKDFFCCFLEMYFRVDKGYYIYSACQYEHVPLTLLPICISSVFQSIQNGNMASPSLWKKYTILCMRIQKLVFCLKSQVSKWLGDPTAKFMTVWKHGHLNNFPVAFHSIIFFRAVIFF